ncbi:MAG: S8 family serine peptidase [candidate division KSB1 bacterium]|nr:S8 family serine peptidase [candidate division KSB1 bacterium]
MQGNQWGLHNTGQFGYTADVDVDALEAWDVTTGSSNVLVAILDSGIDYNHPDLGADFGAYPNQKVVAGYDYVDDDNDPMDLGETSHGTAVAGIIGALTNNDDGTDDHQVAGIGGGWANSPFGFQLLPVRVTQPDGSWQHDDLANAILWAAQTKGADVLNISLSSNVGSSTLRFAITEAFNLGPVIVASMGNNNTSSPWWPAAYDNSLISVGAIDFHGKRISPERGYDWGSNTGSWLDVMAPGLNHWTTARLHSGGYRAFGGTSAAAPFVSGFAGLIFSVDPNASFEKVEAIIRASGTTYPTWSSSEGYGYIKMRKGLDLLSDPNATEYNWTASGGTAINDNQGFVFGSYVYQRYKVTKTVSFPQNFASVPVIWARRNGSTGAVRWPGDETQLYYNYTGIEPGSESATGCQLVTFLYKKYNTLGQFLGWFPTTPSSVTFAYAVLGIPAPSPPPAPQNLVIANAGNIGQNPKLSWDASSGATSYKVCRCAGFYQTCNYQVIATTTNTSYTDNEIIISDSNDADDKFFYYVTAKNSAGESGASNIVSTWGHTFQKRGTAAEQTDAPQCFALHQNYPNPFNPVTEIRYAMPMAGQVTMAVFNLAGHRGRTLVQGPKPSGNHRVLWDGRDDSGKELASGIYFYRIQVRPSQPNTNPFEPVKKMTLLR